MERTYRKRAAGSRGGSRKGISTVVAIAIFFMLFALALTTVFTWQNMLIEYSEVSAQQLSLDNLKVGEKLDVQIIDSTALLLTNPSEQTVRVLHVLSDNALVWNGSFDVGPFASAILRHSTAGGSTYRVVTMRGNIFSAGLDEQRAALSDQAWHVTFLMNDTTSSFSTPYDWSNSTVVGETYWYNTNLNWEWNYTSKVFGNLTYSAGTCIGFVATAKLVIVNESYNATINFLIDTGDSNFDRSKIAFIIDGNMSKSKPIPSVVWYDSSHYVWFTLEGPPYSVHEVSVFFYGKDVEVQKLSLNVVNATFAP
jgi:hypothetical protein